MQNDLNKKPPRNRRLFMLSFASMRQVFPNTIYLNRDVDTSRRKTTEYHLKEHGIQAVRFSAIEEDLQSFIVQPIETIKLNKAQVSCLISHLEILRTYGDQDLLVLEDDIDLSLLHKWPFTFSELALALPPNVGAVQLAYFPVYPKLQPIPWVPGLFSTAAYFVKRGYVAELIKQGFVGGKWDISALKSKYVQPVADSVIYSGTRTMSLAMLGIRDEVSTIFPNATYSKDAHTNINKVWEEQVLDKNTLLAQIKNFK